MKLKQKINFNENYFKTVNQIALGVFALILVLYIGGAATQVRVGTRHVGYLYGVAGVSIITYLIAVIMMKRDSEDQNIGWVFGIGFGGVYVYSVITADVSTGYAFMFPLVVVLMLYRNMKLISTITAVSASAIFIFLFKEFSAGNTRDISVILGITIAFLPVITIVSYIVNSLNDSVEESLQEVNVKNKEQDNILRTLEGISTKVTEEAKNLKVIVDNFGKGSEVVNRSVLEISEGATETATEIENQIILVDSIKDKVNEAADVCKTVESCSINSQNAVMDGLEIVDNLLRKSDIIKNMNKEVDDKIKELEEKSANIANITTVITSIAEQTNLLALNAAIESARVGEQGKGFAVVAEEIKKLAEESKNNAQNIDVILGELKEDISISSAKVEELLKETEEQEELANNTDKAFNMIKDNVLIVRNEIGNITEKTAEIVVGNETIYESISNLSAISEETMARSQETIKITGDNLNEVNSLDNISNELGKCIDEIVEVLK